MNQKNMSNSPVKYVNVPKSAVGQRLDNYLLSLWRRVPRSHVYRLIRGGQVRVNGSRSRVHRKLEGGDIVRLPPINLDIKTAVPIPLHLQKLDLQRLYEDEYLLIINKPPGIAVHQGTGLRAGVIEILRFQNQQKKYLELVHRLDRDTSGCLILAKEPEALRRLHSFLRGNDSGHVRKQYLALLSGKWVGGAKSINYPLAFRRLSANQRRSFVIDDGRKTHTMFTPVERFENYSLMRIDLITGRTHQIRAHAAAIGHPVAGDTKYGTSGATRLQRQSGLRRLFLHASDVRLTHPKRDATIHASAPLETDLDQFLQNLRKTDA
ncbi:MAG: 23S rRNA pseudouridine(955/2504/2580) synthase [Acidiferrobacteraceae bacterium]|nr:23S rRNA pseudouridine(955/2504/2580) synthase [Acidiferrobacteraceae bacterium]